MKVKAHVYVRGSVQGVFFRSSTRAMAKMRGVKGWISNLPDGRVEAVMEGEKDAVDALIDFCREGPAGSRVDDVEVSWEKPSHRFTEFGIRT